jgi:hypothetical protein
MHHALPTGTDRKEGHGMLRRGIVALGLLLMCGGCAEHVHIVTVPPGARIYLDGRLSGTTPYTFSVPRSEIRNIPYKVELENYRTVEGTLYKRVAPGRVVGAFFTLGILYIFRSPFYIESFNQYLAVVPPQTQPSAAPAIPIEERLKRLQELRDDKVLTNEEYERQKAKILESQ